VGMSVVVHQVNEAISPPRGWHSGVIAEAMAHPRLKQSHGSLHPAKPGVVTTLVKLLFGR
jgi:hypothetical protein